MTTLPSLAKSVYAIPVDPEDSAEKLQRWMDELEPPYELRTDVTPDDVAEVNDRILDVLKTEGVPATFITDADGRLLLIRWGPPTVSELRRLLRQVRDRDSLPVRAERVRTPRTQSGSSGLTGTGSRRSR